MENRERRKMNSLKRQGNKQRKRKKRRRERERERERGHRVALAICEGPKGLRKDDFVIKRHLRSVVSVTVKEKERKEAMC